MTEIEIVQAKQAEVIVALAILEEAADWLTSKGQEQWQEKGFERVLDAALARGELYLAYMDGQAAGTFILQWADEDFWGEQPDDAGYIHKVAVRRAFAGQNLGHQMLQWAERKVAEIGRVYLRLDCVAANPIINRYYQQAGFIYCGQRAGSKFYCSLYQKKVS